MNKRGQRLHEALSKLFFCIQYAATPASLLRLLRNTKKLHHFMHESAAKIITDKPEPYQLKCRNKKFTLWLRTYSGDLQIFYEIFWRRVYCIPEIDLASCKTIIDLGGNIGMSALFFGLHAPRASLWVLEPDAQNFLLLCQNIKTLKNAITLLPVAATNKSGMLYVRKSRYAYNTIATTEVTDMPVEAISLNSLIEQQTIAAIDLIKIDIEGAEENLFACNTQWLKITKHIIIEIHSEQAFKHFQNALSADFFALHLLSGSFGGQGIYHAVRKSAIV